MDSSALDCFVMFLRFVFPFPKMPFETGPKITIYLCLTCVDLVLMSHLSFFFFASPPFPQGSRRTWKCRASSSCRTVSRFGILAR